MATAWFILHLKSAAPVILLMTATKVLISASGLVAMLLMRRPHWWLHTHVLAMLLGRWAHHRLLA